LLERVIIVHTVYMFNWML